MPGYHEIPPSAMSRYRCRAPRCRRARYRGRRPGTDRRHLPPRTAEDPPARRRYRRTVIERDAAQAIRTLGAEQPRSPGCGRRRGPPGHVIGQLPRRCGRPAAIAADHQHLPLQDAVHRRSGAVGASRCRGGRTAPDNGCRWDDTSRLVAQAARDEAQGGRRPARHGQPPSLRAGSGCYRIGAYRKLRSSSITKGMG